MVKHHPSEQAHHIVEAIGNNESMQQLGGIQRVKESTLGAIGNVFGGLGRLIFKKGERLRGIAQMGQGVLDALDTVPSAVADVNRFVFGPKDTQTGSGPSGYNYNISRAIGGTKDVKNPLNAIGVAGDIIHAGGFKLASDGLKAIQRNSVGRQQLKTRENINQLAA